MGLEPLKQVWIEANNNMNHPGERNQHPSNEPHLWREHREGILTVKGWREGVEPSKGKKAAIVGKQKVNCEPKWQRREGHKGSFRKDCQGR